MTDPLPGVRILTHCGVNDGTLSLHAQDGTINRLEPASGQSDGAPPTGLRCEITVVEKAVPLPLSWLYGVLSNT